MKKFCMKASFFNRCVYNQVYLLIVNKKNHMRKKFWSMLILSAFTAALLLPSTVLATPITGADADVGALFLYDGSSYTDWTTEANNATAADVGWPSLGGSTVYIGGVNKFSRIYFYISAEDISSSWSIPTAGNTDSFQYFDGSTWSDVTVVNESGAWNATGILYFSLTPPADWASTTINEATNYYVKVNCDMTCNKMLGSFDMDQVSLLTYSGDPPATPEFSTYALLITLGITGFMVFKQTKMNGGLSQA